jgi:hypothetical protein
MTPSLPVTTAKSWGSSLGYHTKIRAIINGTSEEVTGLLESMAFLRCFKCTAKDQSIMVFRL